MTDEELMSSDTTDTDDREAGPSETPDAGTVPEALDPDGPGGEATRFFDAGSLVHETPVSDGQVMDDAHVGTGPVAVEPSTEEPVDQEEPLPFEEPPSEEVPAEEPPGEAPVPIDEPPLDEPSMDEFTDVDSTVEGGAAHEQLSIEDEALASLVEELESEDSEAGTPATSSEGETGSEVAEEEAAVADASADLGADAAREERLSRAEARVAARKADSGSRILFWPFVAYDLLWAAFAGVLVWQLLAVPNGEAAYDAPVYPLLLISGIGLTVLGPVLILVAWLVARRREEESSGHVFISALVNGAIATSIGVAMWWVALLVIDQMRFGTLL